MISNHAYPDFIVDDAVLDAFNKLFIDAIVSSEGARFWDNLRGLRHAFQQSEYVSKLVKHADRTDFLLTPAFVNAWYQPTRNSITFPVASLIPPFYR